MRRYCLRSFIRCESDHRIGEFSFLQKFFCLLIDTADVIFGLDMFQFSWSCLRQRRWERERESSMSNAIIFKRSLRMTTAIDALSFERNRTFQNCFPGNMSFLTSGQTRFSDSIVYACVCKHRTQFKQHWGSEKNIFKEEIILILIMTPNAFNDKHTHTLFL